MRFTDVEIPQWFHDQLLQRYGEGYNFNHIIAMLLEDYLKKNAPVVLPEPGTDEFFKRYAVDQKAGRLVFLIYDNNTKHIPSSKTIAKYYDWKDRTFAEVRMEKKPYVTVTCVRNNVGTIMKDRLTIGKKYIVLGISECGQYYRIKDNFGTISFFKNDRFTV